MKGSKLRHNATMKGNLQSPVKVKDYEGIGDEGDTRNMKGLAF